MKTAFMIAAPTSGSGKTTIARGLMALLRAKGMTVQPFKCGPDYIDTKFHAAVCGRPSINLDTFMATGEHVHQLFAHYGEGADACIVEGMMGLFDGYDRDCGSSAEIARVLGLPVVLVVDARSAAYSMAPLLQGFINFRKDVHIAGVIFNKVGSERHYKLLRQVCDELQIACYGWLPKTSALEQGSRYLGLDFTECAGHRELTALLEEHVDWEQLTHLHTVSDIECRTEEGTLGVFFNRKNTFLSEKENHSFGQRTIGTELLALSSPAKGGVVMVARNAESFSFLYQEVVDRFGAVRYFDPEREVPELDETSLLYLPGGYPEKHLEALAANTACRLAIRNYAERGGRIVAECGGMMYLCQHIVTDEGDFPMCGVLPYSISARRQDRHLSLGYRRFVLDGREYRGHEFHYTQFLGSAPESATQVWDAKGNPVATPVFKYKNVLASYTHLYQI